ncbi:MAG: ABC transporter ATP-binding protein [Akkermansia sp.]|nr:ABC transporter ATP-binding protein [Akkermansia sp.]
MSKKEQKTWPLIRPVLKKYIGPEKGLVMMGILSGVVAAAAAGFGLPFMLQHVFPVVFGESPAPEWLQQWMREYVAPEHLENAVLWGAAMLIPFIMFVRGMATYFNSYLLTWAGMNILTRLRTELFARLQWLSFSFHDRRTRGDLMTSVIQFTQNLQQQMVFVLNDLVIQPLTLVAAVAYLVYAAMTSDESAMLLGNLIISAACVPLVRLVGKRMLKQMRKALSGMNVITATVEESFAAQREVRAFNLEKQREEMLQKHIRGFNGALIRVAAWQQALSPAVECVCAVALAYSLYRGCGSGLTLEQFTAIATAFYFCYDPVKRLGSVANQVQMMGLVIENLNSILNAKDETPEPVEPVALPAKIDGRVDFENVTFGYSSAKTVLKNINVSVPAGQIVALVGPSGSGKTTFINLICRFYDAQKGSVKIDGVDVRKLAREDRTRVIGLVSQFSALFRDTIRENIRVGRAGASNAEVEAAGRQACVDEFVQSHPDGYERVLAEGGTGISGGQKQRVSIARAFLKNAPILILDEATSALDMKSEAVIQKSLDKLAEGHTTFIIAHRFSTIRMAQRILVFEEGRIVADGSHDELYNSCVLYKSLYDEQVKQAQEGKETPTC